MRGHLHITGAMASVLALLFIVGGTVWHARNWVTSGGSLGTVRQSASQRSEDVRWTSRDGIWQSSRTPPVCPSPIVLNTPVGLGRVTSMLYPGQYRGGQYKPHGGFRFDTSRNTDITVRVPMDATVVRGSRYLVNGEAQYTFDLTAPCGILLRFGHLRLLSPMFAALAAQLPAAREGDSRTTEFGSSVRVVAGEVMATAVGLTRDGNVFVDFGVFDLRQRNRASRDPAWSRRHGGELEPYAICWFDWLPAVDAARVRRLPSADASGRTSDYCK